MPVLLPVLLAVRVAVVVIVTARHHHRPTVRIVSWWRCSRPDGERGRAERLWHGGDRGVSWLEVQDVDADSVGAWAPCLPW